MAKRAYRVVAGTSTRKSPDPASPDYEVWVDFIPGEVVTRWPAHAPVDEWVASGHWVPIEKEQP